MKTLIPRRLRRGDTVRVISPSRSLSIVPKSLIKIAEQRLNMMSLKVTYGKNSLERNSIDSSKITSRISDLEAAFKDESVSMIIAAIGGYNCNELLDSLNWDIIRTNPKIFCGFSDITVLNNAIYKMTGLVTYCGPNFASFGQKYFCEYTLNSFLDTLFTVSTSRISPSSYWSDDKWKEDQENRCLYKNKGYVTIQEGKSVGRIIGGNLCSLNLLQGTKCMPNPIDPILFLEDDSLPGKYTMMEFNRNLQSLIQTPVGKRVKGIAIGRFQKESCVNINELRQIILSKPELKRVSVVANVDFGHTDPKITFAIGGRIHMEVSKNTACLMPSASNYGKNDII